MHCIYMFIWEKWRSAWFHFSINEHCMFFHLFVLVCQSVKIFSIISCICLVKFIPLKFLFWLWVGFLNFLSFFSNLFARWWQPLRLWAFWGLQEAPWVNVKYLFLTFCATHCDTYRQGSHLMGLFLMLQIIMLVCQASYKECRSEWRKSL